jgi:DNA-directed RNA polymerase specialized sigma24 family protein
VASARSDATDVREIRDEQCRIQYLLARVPFYSTTEPFDEEQHRSDQPAPDPETLLLQTDDVRLIERAMVRLPARLRELLGAPRAGGFVVPGAA